MEQSAKLLSGTIEENILYGSTKEQSGELSHSDVERVATEVNAHDFISSFPDGYQTEVGILMMCVY